MIDLVIIVGGGSKGLVETKLENSRGRIWGISRQNNINRNF